MIKQFDIVDNWYNMIVIKYGDNGLLIFDKESCFNDDVSDMICLFKWTGVRDYDGVDREINIDGYPACKIIGVDEV